MVLCLFGIFMLAMDIIALSNRLPLFMFGQPLHGLDMVYAFTPVILLILGCAWLANKHKKLAIQAEWRKK